MAWSAVLRRDPPLPSASSASPTHLLPPCVPSPFRSSSSDQLHDPKSIAVAVIDANALILSSSSSSARLFSLACRFVSVREVLEEVRDPASRFHLASLPFTVEILEPSDDSLRRVSQFARETGDLQSLSAVDLKLLALTYMLENQYHGSMHLRSKPPPLQVLQTNHLRERDLPGWGSNVQNLEEWEALSQLSDNSIENHENSRILGLKKLSLNTSQLEKCAGRNEESNAHEDDPVSVNGDGDKEQAMLPNLQTMAVEASPANLLQEERLNDENDHDGDEHEIQARAEKEKSEDEDWQKTLSRSTRRKHERRAARAERWNAMALKEEQEEKTVDTISTAESENLNKICNSTNPVKENIHSTVDQRNSDQVEVSIVNVDVHTKDVESAVDQCNGEQVEDLIVNEDLHIKDTESEGGNECCPINDERICRDECSSLYGTESEDSWMLQPLSNSSIACITADFPMQNVLLQIGLRVVSPNGLQIQKLNRWVLKCEACRHVTSDVGRIFCPKCGNGGTLYKVSVTIGSNGVIHTGTRRRPNIRGTKYSLPMPKGGRQGVLQNPILREDQLPKKMLHPKKKKSPLPEFSVASEIFDTKRVGNSSIQPPIREALAVFSGKRNPNDCRSKPRK